MTDRTGIQTDVNLAVAAGDQLYFVVYGGASTSSGDATSWTPAITYYSKKFPAAALPFW